MGSLLMTHHRESNLLGPPGCVALAYQAMDCGNNCCTPEPNEL